MKTASKNPAKFITIFLALIVFAISASFAGIPTWTAQTTSTTNIRVTFNENVNGDGVANAWTVSSHTVSAATGGANVAFIDLTVNAMTTGETPTVNYLAANGNVVSVSTVEEVANGGAIVATDGIKPTLTSGIFTDNALKVGETSLVTFTFSEAVTGFANADLTIVNGTLTAVASADGNVTWTANFTPTDDLESATNAITVNMTGVTDAATNAGLGTTDSSNYAIDTREPTVTLTDSEGDNIVNDADMVTITATFSESMTSAPTISINNTGACADIVAVAMTGNETNWTYAWDVPTGSGCDGASVVTVAGNDTAGNVYAGADNIVFTVDNTAPSIATLVITPSYGTTYITATTNISAGITETGSGVAGCEYMLDGASWTAGVDVSNTCTATDVDTSTATSINMRATDTAGNVGTGTEVNVTVDTTNPAINSITVAEADAFYSIYGPNSIINLRVNATDADSGIQSVQANFTNVSNCGGTGIVPLSYNATSDLYEGQCDVSAEAAISEFVGGGVSVVALDNLNYVNTSTYSPIILYNMTTPPENDSCMQFGSSTTNFSTVPDFAAVNFVIEIKANLTCQNGGPIPGAPNWTNTFEQMALINFTSIDLSNPTNAQKLQGLKDAMVINITPPGQFGNSRIYFNTTYFASLNTTAVVKLYHLPFTSPPAIVQDVGAAGYNASTTWVQGVGEGNLTFTVYGFSGYNVSDNVTPAITLNYPIQGTQTGDNTTGINVTLNGTGTQISAAYFYVNGSAVAYYNSNGNTANCANETEGSEIFNCLFNTSALADGVKNLSVTAYDYGGSSPGNNATDSITFTIDATPPTTTATAVISNGSAYTFNIWTNSAYVNVTLACSDGTGVGCSVRQYCTDTANTCTPNTTYSTPVQVSTEGTSYIRYRSNDLVNNVETTALQIIKIDTAAPSLTIQNPASNNIYRTSNTISFGYTASDAGSGLASCIYQISDSTPLTVAGCTAFSKTLANGAYNLTINATDNVGRTTSATVNFSVSVSTVGTGGGSTGTGAPHIGVGETPPEEETAPEENVTVVENYTATAEVSNDMQQDTGVFAVVVNGERAAGGAAPVLSGSELDALPPDVPPVADAGVYRYLQLTVDVPDGEVDSATVGFQVPKSWFTENNMDPATVALYRYSNGVWIRLETTMSSEDGENYYYEAITPGFSYFAIVGSPLPPKAPENCLTLGCASGYECKIYAGAWQCRQKATVQQNVTVASGKQQEAGFDWVGALTTLVIVLVAIAAVAYAITGMMKGDKGKGDYKFKKGTQHSGIPRP